MTHSQTIDEYPTRRGAAQVIDREGPVVRGTAADGPFEQADLSTFDERGYVTIPELVSPAELGELRAELSRMSQDPQVLGDERTVVEAESNEVRSIFEVHRSSAVFSRIARDPRVVGRARQLLGSQVYIHQSRVNFKPGFEGKEFSWHSDFETWHAEDGMPTPRAVSISISLTDNYSFNGPLMIMPGSHREYIGCEGETPQDNYKTSLVMQGAGTPDRDTLTKFADRYGIDVLEGSAGGAVMFDSNCMHASNGNVTPFPRSNIFIVYNSVQNAVVEPFSAGSARPSFLAAREVEPVG